MYKILNVILILAAAVLSKDIVFENKEVIISKSQNLLAFLDTDECISPLYFDWDGDGVRDLLTGYWDGLNGYLRFYKNTGGDDFPQFTSWEHIQAAGEDIYAKGG